jgi:hypothetical protein
LVAPSAKAVAQLLGLGRPGLGDFRLTAQPTRQPADEDSHHALDAERESDSVGAEFAPVAVGAQSLAPREERSEREGQHRAADDAIANGRFGDRQEEDLPDRRIRLVGVVEDDIGGHDPGVEAERREAQDLLCAQAEFSPCEKPEGGGPDRQHGRDDPRPALVAGGIPAGDNAHLEDGERHGEQPHPGDPALDLPAPLDLSRHPERRPAAQSACSRTISSGSSR